MMNRYKTYKDDNGVITYQIGKSLNGVDFSQDSTKQDINVMIPLNDIVVCPRGADNNLPEELQANIKANRLMPSVIDKQVRLLYGDGIAVYTTDYSSGKPVRKWGDLPEIRQWLDSWTSNGLVEDGHDLMYSLIYSYYTHGDVFVKWRFAAGRQFNSRRVIAGLEQVDNTKARLASSLKNGPIVNDYLYDDFDKCVVANWHNPYAGFKIYPLLKMSNISNYKYAAISHHSNIDVGEIYGSNKSYQGSKPWLKLSNDNANYIGSFLHNSLAARVHVVIPNEWAKSKETSIRKVCSDNLAKEKSGLPIDKYYGLDVGTQYYEATLSNYINKILSELSEYLSGKDNQGKAFTSQSFMGQNGNIIKWEIIPLDMKYKEYISSLIDVDRRADEVISSAMGIDPSITNISKEGIISKSGSDSYYNYLIYQGLLSSDEKICCDPYNMALLCNFPDLYMHGYRIGLYRSTIQRQQDVSPSNRITNESSF